MSHAITRRALGKLLFAAPAAAAFPLEESKDAKPSEAAEFLASHEPGFSEEERERLRKALASQEKSLKVVREFVLPRDTEPALRFSALRSRR
jgi:hypothetical protein